MRSVIEEQESTDLIGEEPDSGRQAAVSTSNQSRESTHVIETQAPPAQRLQLEAPFPAGITASDSFCSIAVLQSVQVFRSPALTSPSLADKDVQESVWEYCKYQMQHVCDAQSDEHPALSMSIACNCCEFAALQSTNQT